MPKYLRFVLFWSVFGGTTLTIGVWLLIVYAFHRLFNPKGINNACHNVATLWGRTSMRLAPGWKFRVEGAHHLPKIGDKPAMLVANHASAVDIWALYLVDCQFRWLSKDQVFRIPIIGWAMTWAGYVPVKRGDKGSQNRAIIASREWLRRGTSMVFFPEGTRSRDGKLQEFKSGAFRIALDEGVDVIPIVLKGTRDLLVKNSAMPSAATLVVEIMAPIKALPGEDAEQFAVRVRGIIEERLTIPVVEARESSAPHMVMAGQS